MQGQIADYPWADELEKTVINSLSTTFGLDLLLFQDKQGGHVDTIFNVRQGVYASEEEKNTFDNRPQYDSTAYHTHKNYINTGAEDKKSQKEGSLHDPYRNVFMGERENRNLDHVISSHEIANDPGRILADLDGVKLANQSSNLQSTSETINKSKKQKPIKSYIEQLPSLVSQHKSTVAGYEKALENMPRDTLEQQHNARLLEQKIVAGKNKIKELESIDVKGMQERDNEARKHYESILFKTYYSSNKFLRQTMNNAINAGVRLGIRQALGLVFAEIWFELREAIPRIISEMKSDFSFKTFTKEVGETLKNIWTRVSEKFDEIISTFRSNTVAGMAGNIQTTLANIFTTTSKKYAKIIRELWIHIISGIKLVIFNPEKLEFVDLCKALVGILSAGVSAVVGSMLHAYLLPLCSFPFGGEVAAFVSALVTGIATIGLNYFLIYSPFAKALWEKFEQSMPYARELNKFRAINAELDRYLEEYSRLEFNIDADELFLFSLDLQKCNSELERNVILKIETEKRNLEMPFEFGNTESTKQMLKSLLK